MADIALEDFNGLVHSIYRAATEPTEWAVFVETLSGLLGGTVISLQAHDTTAKTGLGIYISKVDPSFLSSYEQYYSSKNVWASALEAHPSGKVIDSEDLFDLNELHKTEFYNDYLKPQDFFAANTIVFHRSQGKVLLLAGTIRQQEIDRVRAPLRKMLAVLAPHIARSCEMARNLPAYNGGEDYRIIIEASDDARFLIDQYGRVTHANRAATSLQKEASLVSIRRDGYLQFRDPQADSAMQAALGAIKRADFIRFKGDFIIRRAMEAPLRAMMAPIERSEARSIFDLAFDDLPIASLVVLNHQPRPALLTSMSRAYGLTPAELALAQAVAEGVSPRAYAETRGISIHTVRTQLRTVFSKTETRRQSQLAALMLRLVDLK
jgi:DNA-binding CsgD family transcriptional regulator/PAS domain-containing protein